MLIGFHIVRGPPWPGTNWLALSAVERIVHLHVTSCSPSSPGGAIRPPSSEPTDATTPADSARAVASPLPGHVQAPRIAGVVPTAAFAWGLQFAFFNPALALILAGHFNATAAQIGLALGLYNVSGFVSSLVIPLLADRRRNYLTPIMWSGLATMPLMAVLGLTTNLIAAVAALIVFGGPASVGSSLLFAHLRSTGFPQRSIINTRAVVSFAWVAGPPIATLLAGAFGDRAVLLAIAVIAALGLMTTFILRRRSSALDVGHAAATNEAASGQLPVIAIGSIGIAFVALQATNYVVTSVLALYVSRTLHLPVVWAGVALAVAAAAEIPALLFAGRLATRFSNLTLIAAACVVGACYYVAMAFVQGPIELVAAQLLNAAFFAVIAGVGLTLFQDVIPRPGLASGLFTNVRRVGAVVSGGLVALTTLIGGYRNMFLICAGLTLVALCIILAVSISTRRRAAAQP